MIGYGYGVGLSPNIASLGGSSYNADAEAWFAVADVPNGQKQAYSDFVDEWQGYGLWDKTYQILPLLLADATKNTKDMKLAFNSVNYGGITHAATGVTGNGSTGYIDAIFNPFSDGTLNNIGISLSCNTDSVENLVNFGSLTSATARFIIALSSYGFIECQINSDATMPYTVANANSIGQYTFTRVDASNVKVYKAGSLVTTFNISSVEAPNLSLNIMRPNNVANYSAREYNMWIVHEAFNATEAANANTAISNLKTALGI